MMDRNALQECIIECESALMHLNKALSNAHAEAKARMQHAANDLEECINECRSLL